MTVDLYAPANAWQARAERAEAELAHLRDVLRAAERGDCVSKSMLGNTCKCCKARRTPSAPPDGGKGSPT